MARGLALSADRMTDLLGFAAYLLLPLIGIMVWRLEGVRRLDLDGRLAIAGAAGAVIGAVTMALMSLAGMHWSRTRLFVVFAIFALAGVWLCVSAGFSR